MRRIDFHRDLKHEGRQDKRDDYARAIALMLDHGVDVNENLGYGLHSYLHVAAAHSSVAVATLLAHGADLEANKYGSGCPLFTACHCGNLEAAELLLAEGAAVHAANDHGITAMAVACQMRNSETRATLLWEIVAEGDPDETFLEIIKRNLDYGANPLQEDAFGRTPMDIVEHAGDAVVVALLRSRIP
jgi:ankyrin repeat protein